MTVLFKCKTSNAYTVKVLAELLQNKLKTAHFEVDSKGIRLSMMDHHRTMLTHLTLDRDSFCIYKFKSPEKMFLGINLNHFHQMLRSIKKKDSLQLLIDSDAPTDLVIKVIPREKNRITTSVVKIQEVQNIDTDLPTGYNRVIIVPSSDFSKMVKEMRHIGRTIHITSKHSYIKFLCDAEGVLKREVEFGELDDLDDDSDEEDNRRGSEEDDNIDYDEQQNSREYDQYFETEQLSRITKLAGLGSNIQIYPHGKLPLLFKSTVGTLGSISIYMKSKDQIDQDRYISGSESDSE